MILSQVHTKARQHRIPCLDSAPKSEEYGSVVRALDPSVIASPSFINKICIGQKYFTSYLKKQKKTNHISYI